MNLNHFSTALVESLGWVLFHSVWQLMLVALVALLLARAMRRSTASSRYTMLVVALAAMTLLPIATLLFLPLPLPAESVPIAVGAAENPASGEPRPRDQRPTMAPSATPLPPAAGTDRPNSTTGAALAASSPAATAGEPWWTAVWESIADFWSSVELAVRTWLEWIVGAWCLGVFVFAWRPAVSWYEIGRLRRIGCSPAADHVVSTLAGLARRMRLSRAVQVIESTRVHVPVVIGYLRPVILLPVSLASQLPVAQLEAILAHELAHVRRHDYLINLWQTLVETVLFYHPAVWWLSHRIRVERENCCDDVAVAVVENRVEYGRALLAVAELVGPQTTLALGARSGSLLARVARLFPRELGDRRFESGNLAALGLLAAALLSLVVWTTAVAKDVDEGGDPNASYADAVSDRFVAALAKQNLPFVAPEALAALRTELHDYLDERVTTPLTGAGRTAVLKALDVYVPNEFLGRDAYLNFRSSFNVLKWRLWTAAERRELSPEEIDEREAQRRWMRGFIASLDVQPAAPQHSGREATLQSLEKGAFGDPLCPFFHDPMTPEEFETFKKKAAHFATLPSTAWGMFISAAQVRIESLEKRWPPGFAVTGDVTGYAAGDVWRFSLCPTLFNRDCGIVLEDSFNGPRAYYDVASNRSVYQDGPRDEKATELWLAKNKQGDLRFDPETKQLIAVRGAKLATLDETEWYAVDRISTADLHRRVAEAPLASYSLAALPSSEPSRRMAAQEATQKLPTLLLESAEGRIAPLRVAHFDSDPRHVHVLVQIHGRPLPPYPPFNAGDEANEGQSHGAAATVPETVDLLSDRFAAALKKQEIPFVTPEALSALRAELHDYLAERVKTPLAGSDRSEVLKAIDRFVQRGFNPASGGSDLYLTFRGGIDMLKWQLWTATDRRALTPDELKQRESQREWMRDYIRGLPEDDRFKKLPDESHSGQLKRLETDVFGYRLSPFFHDPMPADQFETFKTNLLKREAKNMYLATHNIFAEAGQTRIDALLERWPPGFWVGGIGYSDFVVFGPFDRVFARDRGGAGLGGGEETGREFFDVARGYTVKQLAPLDAEATERWLAKNQRGDLWFDPNTRQLIAVRGAKLATLDETDWYVIDQIPLAELRRRVAASPLDSYSLAEIPDIHTDRAEQIIRALPTLVLQSATGEVTLLRVTLVSHGSVVLKDHRRPLPPYPPFNAGDVEYERPVKADAAALPAATTVLAAADPAAADAKEHPAGAERVLHFPADRTMGTVYVRMANEHGYAHGVAPKEWNKVGQARGDVRVPVGKELRLDLNKAASSDLSGLDGLAPDDLALLNCRNTDVTDAGLPHIGRLTGLMILELDQTRITDAGTGHLAGLKKLRHVDLDAFGVNHQGFGVGDETLKVLGGLLDLETIRLRDTKVTGAGLAALTPLKSLGQLGLAGTKIGDAGLVHLKQLPALVSLDLGVSNEGAEITDEGLKTIGELTNLTYLSLSGNKITDAGLIHLHKLSRLEDLSLDNTGITEAGLANLEPLQSLEELRLYTGHNVTDVGTGYLAKLKSLRRLTENLRITEVGLAQLATLPKLETLSLTDLRLTAKGARQIAGMKSLRWLHFWRCPFGDQELAAMCDLPNLEWLALSGTHVSGNGLKAVARLPKLSIPSIDFGDRDEQPAGLKPGLREAAKLSRLKDLRITGWGLDSSDLKEIAGMMNLEELQLNMGLDDQGAEYIGGLRHLQTLEIHNSVLTDRGLKYLSTLQELTYLNLSGHFTDRGLDSLAKLQSLEGLQIHSPYITPEGVRALERKLPALQYCNLWGASDDDRVSISDKDTIRRYGTADERAAKDALEDKMPPPLRVNGWLNTEPGGLDFDKLHGKVVLVDFWGTWCGPCRAMTPKLQALDEKYRDQGLVVLGIHATKGAEEMPAYVEQHKLGWPEAVDVDKATADAWKVTGYPTLYLIDRWGKLRFADFYSDDAEAAVSELLGEKSPPQSSSGR